MAAPTRAALEDKGAYLATELEKIDEAIKALQADRAQFAEQAKDLLEKNIPVLSERTEYYLCPSTTVKIAAANGILTTPLLSAELREKLTTVDTAKLKKFHEAELVPDEAWSQFVTVTQNTIVQMRSRDRKPATAETKKKALEAAA